MIKADALNMMLNEKTFELLHKKDVYKLEFRDMTYVEETTTRHRDFIVVDEIMQRNLNLFWMLHQHGYKLLLLGQSSTSKTTYLNTYKTLFDKNQENTTIRVGMTVFTDPMNLENKIESKMTKKGKTSLGGKGAAKILVIIDD